jgi:hypothetical protein
MTRNHHAGGTGRGGWHDHPRKSKQEGGGGENYTTRSHQDFLVEYALFSLM